MKFIDLRSDTVTTPTPEMRRAMSEAEVGDDVYGEDPTVSQLEARSAAIMGKEAAVFVPTGTMGNQASIMAWTRPGDEIITGAGVHIVRYEGGGPARLSGVACAQAQGSAVTPDDIRTLFRDPGNAHYPLTRLVCLENALGNGQVMPLADMEAVRSAARELGLTVHLDGARIFNAAASLEVTAGEIAAQADSLTFCLSKGLAAPVGSVVCGPRDFIALVRRCRKVLGGGMRQVGVLAACGLVALNTMVDRLADDHANARRLAALLAEMPEVEVNPDQVQINMVFWRSRVEFDDRALVEFMAGRGFKVSPRTAGTARWVTHKDVTRADVEAAAVALKDFIASGRIQ